MLFGNFKYFVNTVLLSDSEKKITLPFLQTYFQLYKFNVSRAFSEGIFQIMHKKKFTIFFVLFWKLTQILDIIVKCSQPLTFILLNCKKKKLSISTKTFLIEVKVFFKYLLFHFVSLIFARYTCEQVNIWRFPSSQVMRFSCKRNKTLNIFLKIDNLPTIANCLEQKTSL